MISSYMYPIITPSHHFALGTRPTWCVVPWPRIYPQTLPRNWCFFVMVCLWLYKEYTQCFISLLMGRHASMLLLLRSWNKCLNAPAPPSLLNPASAVHRQLNQVRVRNKKSPRVSWIKECRSILQHSLVESYLAWLYESLKWFCTPWYFIHFAPIGFIF